MNDDLEQRLCQVTPRGVTPDVRSRILGAISTALSDDDTRVTTDRLGTGQLSESFGSILPASNHAYSRLSNYLLLAVVMLMLIGAGLNVWVNQALDRRLVAVLGPPPLRKQAAEIASDVASITDQHTGQRVYQFLATGRPVNHSAKNYAARLDQMIRQLTAEFKESAHDPNQKSSQMDWYRRRHSDCHRTDSQCMVRREHRSAA